ncbi:SDR family oxidoreductase [Thiohalorhabdus sp. Cl-TMA]|uniref:SDR family oxidoreductase n=1 Tax=Thiohalorhabdus methylotrophus TaxID=3242694 RepID=A0ABV4TXJ2_9GAMM
MAHAFTVLLTEVTGKTGSALLRLLEKSNVAVRAMVRDEGGVARLGSTSASVMVGDFDDPGALEEALDGVDSAYLVTPSSPEAAFRQIRFSELASSIWSICRSSPPMKRPRSASSAITPRWSGGSASSE